MTVFVYVYLIKNRYTGTQIIIDYKISSNANN